MFSHNRLVQYQLNCGHPWPNRTQFADLHQACLLFDVFPNFIRLLNIACSTGIASTHYGKLGGTTLHKWSGIVDDLYLNEEIVHLIKTDERFNDDCGHPWPNRTQFADIHQACLLFDVFPDLYSSVE
jgi:hypothetical protein